MPRTGCIHAGLMVLACALPPACFGQEVELARGSFHGEIKRPVELEYLIHLPSEYDGASLSPLLLYLHGGGAAGRGLDRLVARTISPRVLLFISDLPLILLAPVLPNTATWQPEDLNALLDHVLAEYDVDEDRVYLVGWSRGGNGAWKLGADYSERFAAVVPIAGMGVHNVCRIRPAAVWIFHGADDTTVIPESSESMHRNLEGCGADVRLTVYPDVGHDAQGPTFSNPGFWEWLLSQRR